MGMLISISIAAKICGVCPKTLRRWDAKGLISPLRTQGGHRRYCRAALIQFIRMGTYSQEMEFSTGIAAIYSRVSSAKQKKDLQTQTLSLINRAISDGFEIKVYSDIGSGLNDSRPRFLKMLADAVGGIFDRIYITYRDRFARFGIRGYKTILEALDIPVIGFLEESASEPETRLVNDVLAVITSFAGKLHRSRRGKIGA